MTCVILGDLYTNIGCGISMAWRIEMSVSVGVEDMGKAGTYKGLAAPSKCSIHH